jgi:hypothetical protein
VRRGCVFCRQCAGAGSGRPPKGLTFLVSQTEHRFTPSRWTAGITSFLLVAFQNLPRGNFARHRLEVASGHPWRERFRLPRGCHWCSGFKGIRRCLNFQVGRERQITGTIVAKPSRSVAILYLSPTCRKRGTSTAEPAKPKPSHTTTGPAFAS